MILRARNASDLIQLLPQLVQFLFKPFLEHLRRLNERLQCDFLIGAFFLQWEGYFQHRLKEMIAQFRFTRRRSHDGKSEISNLNPKAKSSSSDLRFRISNFESPNSKPRYL